MANKAIKYPLCAVLFYSLIMAGCKKQAAPNAVLSLQYQSSIGSYSQSCEYMPGSFSCLAYSSIVGNTTHSPGVDSVTLGYSSYLGPVGSNNGCQLEINQTYAINRLDSQNGQWWVKNDSDFTRVFQNGSVATSAAYYLASNVNVLIIMSGDSTGGYSFIYGDTSDHFSITQATNIQVLRSNGQYGPGLFVYSRFSGRMVRVGSPFDTIKVSNGVFQGVFTERI